MMTKVSNFFVNKTKEETVNLELSGLQSGLNTIDIQIKRNSLKSQHLKIKTAAASQVFILTV